MRRPPPPRRPGRPTPTSAASRARLPATAVRATGPSLAARRSSPSPLRLRCGRCRDLFAEFAAQLRQFLLLRVDGQQRHAAAQQHRQREVADHQREHHQRIDQYRGQLHGHQHAQLGHERRRAQAQPGFFQLPVKAA
ncbi:hypothetical protein G6F63_015895 [Rhizopus arrhizus]|nr:hypothetical protein G6F63_015895 [Rhizopus arrhizus]